MITYRRAMSEHIAEVIEALRESFPSLSVQQHRAVHPADDVGIWFFRLPDCDGEVQVESSTGNLPFLIEWTGGEERIQGVSIPAVVAQVKEFLGRFRGG